MKIVALIPARSGSKGLKNKNIKLILGKPVISYSIKAAIDCREINKCYLNSDSKKYLKIGKKFGAESFLRPKRLANNTASMKSVIIHFIRTLEQKGEFYDALILLSPTFPLRSAKELKKLIYFYKKENKKSIIGLKKPETHPYLCYKTDKNKNIKNILNINVNNFYRRQKYPNYYELTHYFSMFPTDSIFKLNAQLYSRDTKGYFLKNDIPIINIDTKNDIELAEFYLKKLRKNKK